ncbi:MAG: DUF484 family protein [Gammaproteobacteria bacterium]|nr:DUF484 family protein [Gammaproteobacteria bacterium]
MSTDEQPLGLTDQDVMAYLRGDPEFFRRYPGLLSELNLPHESGTAVSLIERQVAILRERNMNMRRRMNELVKVAKDNDELFGKTRTLTLELLHVRAWHDLNEVLATYLLADFQADFVCCHLLNQPVSMDHLVNHDGELPHESHVVGNRPVCTTLRPVELNELFPIQNHQKTGSAVLAPLAFDASRGCLAIGSRDPDHFTSQMDTLFVTYISEVLSGVVQRLAQ